MTLTKADIIQEVYKKHDGITKVDATKVVEAILRISKECLTGGSDLLLSVFGKFTIRDKAKRKGRNPQTGETLILNARRVVTFSSSGILRDRVNDN